MHEGTLCEETEPNGSEVPPSARAGGHRAPLPRPGSREERRGPARRIVSRDVAILAWLARQRFATAAQVGERFSMSSDRAARRLGQLAGAGCLDRRQPYAAPSVYLVSRTGLAVAGSELPPPELDLRTYRHDLGLTALALELELAGETTVTEREMRHREATGTGSYAARFTPDPSGRSPRRHFPDLAVERHDGRLDAYELELTPKRTRRLSAILRAYRRSLHVASVVYYVDRRDVGQRLEELARTLHLEGRLSVRWW